MINPEDLDELWGGLTEDAVRRGQPADSKWTAQAWRAEAQEVIARVRAKVGAHAYPRRVAYVAALAKTTTGKINRNALRQSVLEEKNMVISQ